MSPTLKSSRFLELNHNPCTFSFKSRFQCLYLQNQTTSFLTSPSLRIAPLPQVTAERHCHQGATRSYRASLRRIFSLNVCPSRQNVQPPRPRDFTTTTRKSYKTIQEARVRNKFGPLSVTAVLVFFGTGFGMIFYFRTEKERLERQRIADASKGLGRPKVGGRFELLNQEGKTFTSEDMKGRFSLVYFGFTHCPDICPEELDKMSDMINLVSAQYSSPPSSTFTSTSNPRQPLSLLPLFITCDPARDTPSVLNSYLREFHPSMIGLTGTWDQIKAVCKLYRVYFSTPEGVKPGMDYLVDHSIYFYLMDPEGDFVEAIGRQHSAEAAARIITAHMGDWKRSGKTSL